MSTNNVEENKEENGNDKVKKNSCCEDPVGCMSYFYPVNFDITQTTMNIPRL